MQNVLGAMAKAENSIGKQLGKHFTFQRAYTAVKIVQVIIKKYMKELFNIDINFQHQINPERKIVQNGMEIMNS